MGEGTQRSMQAALNLQSVTDVQHPDDEVKSDFTIWFDEIIHYESDIKEEQVDVQVKKTKLVDLGLDLEGPTESSDSWSGSARSQPEEKPKKRRAKRVKKKGK